MKKTVLKIFIILVVFFATIIITANIINLESNDMTSEMAEASLPVVSLSYGETVINPLYGYLNDMDISYMRGSITPLSEGRRLGVIIDTCGEIISDFSFEVRSADGSRLIENTQVTGYEVKDNKITSDITIKDLIELNKEYELIIKLLLGDGRMVRYYTRIINPDEYYVGEKLLYVRDFTDKTFNKVLAGDLTKYLEPNSQGDNTSFGYVNIHSSFDQVTWGDLAPLRVTEPQLTIKELSPLTGSFITDFYVSLNDEDGISYYRVREFFRIRYSKERMYLLDYERTMDRVFTDEASAYSDGVIMLGINSGNEQLSESDDGNTITFTSAGRLYTYSLSENKIAYLFGFYDRFNEDMRTLNPDHDIKVIKIDETGSVTFLVYGYMSRGLHEGEAGITAYYYDASVNTIEELAYIPSTHAPDLLMDEVEELSYINSDGMFYMLAGSTFYGIDTRSHSVSVIAENIEAGSFRVSENNRFIAYNESDSVLLLNNLDTGKVIKIRSGYNETVTPISFIGEDLIYGTAKKEDIIKDRTTGNTIAPMYEVVIYNALEGRVMSYERENIYVISGEVNGNQIVLKRMEQDPDTGEFFETSDDQIVNSLDEASTKNMIETVATEKYEKLTEIKLKSANDASSMKHLSPKYVLFEGGRTIHVAEGSLEDEYVVYGKYGADSLYISAANAVKRAYEISGVVMNYRGDYIYKKISRSRKNQIMAVKEAAADEDRGSLAVCLDTMLEYEGYVRNSQYMLNMGTSVVDILKDALTDYEVLDLTGCLLDTVLYYVSLDIPVLVMSGEDDALLLIGYNETNAVVMNPLEGSIYKVGLSESEEWFMENGNRFLTYVKKE